MGVGCLGDWFLIGRVCMSTLVWLFVDGYPPPAPFQGRRVGIIFWFSCHVAIGCDLGGRVMGPNVLPWSLSLGLCTSTSAPSLSIASAVAG